MVAWIKSLFTPVKRQLIDDGVTDLYDVLFFLLNHGGRDNIDPRSLPHLGGDAPKTSMVVWSWDKTHMIVGRNVNELVLVKRGAA